MPYLPPYEDYPSPTSPEEAESRATYFRTIDPFPDIPRALLSSEHVMDYIRVTGMLHPVDFSRERGRLKAASYEALPGKKFIRWDDKGQKVICDIKAEEEYELPRNSITFIQIEPKIRLPDYIALRFNLRIKHVHRGLLLGTGPLVDPGFKGDLLIPLHNLTSEPYRIKGNEGLIWIEFTKTSHNPAVAPRPPGEFREIERHKTDVRFEAYFERASQNNPIRSSIPIFIKDANDKARQADMSARRALRTTQIFAGIGILAIAGLVVALHTYFTQVNANAIAANSLAGSVGREAVLAGSDAKRALGENRALKTQLETAQEQIGGLTAQMQKLLEEVSQLRQRRGGSRP